MLVAGWLVTWLVTQGTLVREARAAGSSSRVPSRLALPFASFAMAMGGVGAASWLLRLAERAWPTAVRPSSVVFYAALWAASVGLALLLVPAVASDLSAGRPTWPPPLQRPPEEVGARDDGD
jgi:hypothetical protein